MPTMMKKRITEQTFRLCLTYTVDSISFKSNIAGTHKATKHISTGGIHMTIVHIQFTFINVCQKKNQQVTLLCQENQQQNSM